MIVIMKRTVSLLALICTVARGFSPQNYRLSTATELRMGMLDNVRSTFYLLPSHWTGLFRRINRSMDSITVSLSFHVFSLTTCTFYLNSILAVVQAHSWSRVGRKRLGCLVQSRTRSLERTTRTLSEGPNEEEICTFQKLDGSTLSTVPCTWFGHG